MKVLITGASSGIGAELARQFHLRGASIVVVARRRDRLERLVGELTSSRPNSAEFLQADLATAPHAGSDVERVAAWVRANEIDVLVNNAGIGSFGPYEELPLAGELGMTYLNIVTPLVLAHAAIPGMKQRRRGVLITVSSIAAFQPLPFMATYAATKAFELSHSIALREELKEFGIHCMAICPGPTETEFFGVARVRGTFGGVKRDSVQDVVAESMRALDRRKRYVIPCMRPKLLSLASRLLPPALTMRFTGRAMKKTLEAARSMRKEGA